MLNKLYIYLYYFILNSFKIIYIVKSFKNLVQQFSELIFSHNYNLSNFEVF